MTDDPHDISRVLDAFVKAKDWVDARNVPPAPPDPGPTFRTRQPLIEETNQQRMERIQTEMAGLPKHWNKD